jgi:D-alanyl-D-alanine carboxypeptidase/D-alanyl-D-alanine-endopeptidase (penicillin-binding protein 4)
MRRATPVSVALSCLLVTSVLTPASAAGTTTAATTAASRAAVATPATVTTATDAMTAAAVGSAVSTRASNRRIKKVLRKRTRSKVLGKRFTMTVWDSARGSYVYKRRSKKSLRGASTTKILTAVGVLHTLGPEHRFTTSVRTGATPDEIVLVAGGDPLLSSAELRELAASTAAALGFTSPDPDPTPSGAPSVAPEPTASPAPSPSPTPASTPQRTITVRADDSLFGGSVRSKGWRRSWLPRQVRPVGAFARDDNKVWNATKDAGTYFAAALAKLGVPATYAGEATASPDASTLATSSGHTVAEAVSRMLLVSDNDTAEMLFRHTALGRGLKATWRGSRKALTETLRELRIPMSRVRIVDGSGLSMKGRVTARALTAALARALSPEHPELAGIRGWLPVAGRTGTLRASYKRFHSRPARCAAGKVQGKTGTLADAISLAGYATGADGRTKVYVSIVNSRPTRYSRLQTRWAVDRAVSSVTGCW